MNESINSVGIGKVILSSLDNESYNIPHLHFLICKNDSYFEAINLEFGLVATDKNSSLSVEILTKMLIEYILSTIQAYGFNKLTEIVSSSALDSFWKEYRILEFKLAGQKKDVGHGIVQYLTETIKQQILKEYGIKSEAKYSVMDKAA